MDVTLAIGGQGVVNCDSLWQEVGSVTRNVTLHILGQIGTFCWIYYEISAIRGYFLSWDNYIIIAIAMSRNVINAHSYSFKIFQIISII